MFHTIMKGLIGLRNGFSRVVGIGYMKTDWEPFVPVSLLSFREFIKRSYRWTSDPLYGILDHVQPVEHMNYQLKTNKFIRGDCDDLATYSCYTLSRMGFTPYRVNVYTHKHVICVFSTSQPKRYHYVDNDYLSVNLYAKLSDAVKAAFPKDGKKLDYILEDMNS